MNDKFNIALDLKLVNRANPFLKKSGLNIKDVFELFLENIIEKKGINLSEDENFNEKTKKALLETKGEIFDNIEDMLAMYDKN